MNYRVSFSTLLQFFFILIAFFISYFVCQRGPNVDYDYQSYREMFYNYNSISVEPVFKFISYFFQNFNNGFIYLLFFFCFFSILLKMIGVLKAKEMKIIFNGDVFYFILFYFTCFFGLWDLTQIRASLAISFFILSVFIFNRFKKFTLIVLSVFSHYSLIFVLAFDFLFNLLKKNLALYLISVIVASFLIKFVIGYTSYDAYNAVLYKENFVLFSFKNLYILTSFTVIFINANIFRNQSNPLLLRFSAISIGLFILYLVLGTSYPSAAIRIADFSLFFSLYAFVFSGNNMYLKIYRFITLFILSTYFIVVLYLGDQPIISLKSWGN